MEVVGKGKAIVYKAPNISGVTLNFPLVSTYQAVSMRVHCARPAGGAGRNLMEPSVRTKSRTISFLRNTLFPSDPSQNESKTKTHEMYTFIRLSTVLTFPVITTEVFKQK